MIRPYEGIIFLKPSLSEAEMKTVIAKIKNIIADIKGTITEEKAPEKKKLPYAMGKNLEGFYYFTKFDMESTSIAGLKSRVNLIEEVIRCTISSAVPPPKPAAPVEAKPEKATIPAAMEPVKPDAEKEEEKA